ncbi:right-handed parallel beta-helix repeat-containing protein [Streptomyces curacoi]|uniref:Stage V sporulation protein K n=1 Tax=Streptomyces curacoi TaxID=146536 RepID=A0A117PEQ4_9ACTN|nr:right-handed parallel beta-helix repeat-containing protein [Streptomyces curacoi]KUM78280.1 stage V sporulation protein K [Streptomyces curacoi]
MLKRYVVSQRGGWRTCPDITSALRAAERARSARIEIMPGHYEEQLTVRGAVELVAVGEPGAVVVCPSQGTVLDASGSVVVRGLVLVGRDADVVDLQAGTLTLDRVEVRAHGGVCLHARRNTAATLTDSRFQYGRTLFAGAHGTVERCRFADAADNALAVIEGARVTVQDSSIDGSRIHGIRVSDAWAQLTRCEITGTEKAAVCGDTRAELNVTDCAITAVHADALMFIEQSRGSVLGTRVTDAEFGIAVTTGADPLVRGCVFAACRDSGINVHSAGRGTFQDCEVIDAGVVSVFSTKGGAPRVTGGRISGGNVGIAVIEKARGHFSDVDIQGLTNVALRVRDESRAVFENIRVERCPAGLETLGNAGTTAELVDSRIHDFDMAAVAAGGQSRITLKGVSAERGLVGFGAVEESQLRVHDCEVRAVRMGGALASGKATLLARNLTVTGSEGVGLSGQDSAYVDVADSRFDGCDSAGVSVLGSGGGVLRDCSVTGTKGLAVLHNGLVELVSLRTSLRVVQRNTEPAAPPPTTVINNFYGPVFHEAVHNAQLAWNNAEVVQQQNNESRQQNDESPSQQQNDEDGAGT